MVQKNLTIKILNFHYAIKTLYSQEASHHIQNGQFFSLDEVVTTINNIIGNSGIHKSSNYGSFLIASASYGYVFARAVLEKVMSFLIFQFHFSWLYFWSISFSDNFSKYIFIQKKISLISNLLGPTLEMYNFNIFLCSISREISHELHPRTI
jgi:hypothetical protein